MFNVQIIAKNTIVLSISQILSYLFAFFYTIAIARYLGSDGFGILSFAIAFTSIFGILADLGLNTLTVKEISKNKSLARKFLGNFLLIKIVLSIVTLLIIALILNIFNYPSQTVTVVYLIALSVILNAFTGIFNSIYQTYEKMTYQSIGQIFYSALMLIGVLLAVIYGFNIIGFAFLYFIFSAILLAYNVIICIKKFIPLNFGIDLSFSISKIKEALPFGINSIFVFVYVWIDTIMLFILQGNQAVGWYNAAYKIVTVFMIVQTVSNISIFPAMSQLYVNSQNSLKKLVEKYFKFMLLISFPLGIGITLLSPSIILLIFGKQYENSIIALQILIWSGIFTFLYTAFAQLFLSAGKQVTLTKITGICMIENILLNLILIPKFSYVGTSIVTVVTEFTLLVLIFIVAKNMGYGISVNQLKDVVKVIIASLVMASFIFFFSEFTIFIIVPISILIYVFILFSLKTFDASDLLLIKKLLNN